jgi:hypothetical protein
MKKFLKNIFSRRSRGSSRRSPAKADDEALTKKPTPKNTPPPNAIPNAAPHPSIPDAPRTTYHVSHSPISPIVSTPPPVSEDVTPNSSIEKDGLTAVPSPGGEGKGEGELSSAEGADPAVSTCSTNSKIACLPHDIRKQLNQRLRDGQRSPQILPWLNELPAVKEILIAQFSGKPVNRQNLSNWRHSGYQLWLKEQSHIIQISHLANYASGLSNAGNDTIAHGAATIAAAKILQYVDALLASDCSPDDLLKIVNALKPLLNGAQVNARIKLAQERISKRDEQNKIQNGLARERIRQGDDKLLLTRHKHERDVTAVGLRLLGDARAKEIEAAPVDNREKIEMLGRHMHERTWRHRPIPNLENLSNFPSKPTGKNQNQQDGLCLSGQASQHAEPVFAEKGRNQAQALP